MGGLFCSLICGEFAFGLFPMLAVASCRASFRFPNAIGAVLKPMVAIVGHRLLILSFVMR
jgi:hypothetical protein